MYDPRNILKQSPESLRDWILTLLAVLVVVKPELLSPQAVAAGGVAVYKTLTIFYVAPATKAKQVEDVKVLTDLKEEATLEGIKVGATTVNDALGPITAAKIGGKK